MWRNSVNPADKKISLLAEQYLEEIAKKFYDSMQILTLKVHDAETTKLKQVDRELIQQGYLLEHIAEFREGEMSSKPV